MYFIIFYILIILLNIIVIMCCFVYATLKLHIDWAAVWMDYMLYINLCFYKLLITTCRISKWNWHIAVEPEQLWGESGSQKCTRKMFKNPGTQVVHFCFRQKSVNTNKTEQLYMEGHALMGPFQIVSSAGSFLLLEQFFFIPVFCSTAITAIFVAGIKQSNNSFHPRDCSA